MADKLTPQQEMAVYDRGGDLLVSAAAGSGKTKVLVDRLLRYILDVNDPANIDDFLIITYTKAAASELRGKIAAKLAEKIAQDPENRHLQKQMQRLFLTKISTVHGFCADVLRDYAYRVDIPADFQVADENETQEIRSTVINDLLDSMYDHAQQEPDFCAFIDSQGLGRDDRLVPEIILKVYDSSRCHENPDAWLETSMNVFLLADDVDISQTVWGKYLIDDLHQYLNAQILVFEQCIQDAEGSDGMQKVVINLKETLYQMVSLRDANTWDAIVKHRAIEYGRLTFPRKNVDAMLCDRIKAARNACKKNLEKKLNSFTDNSQQILQDIHQILSGVRGLHQLVEQFGKAYYQAKQARRVLDFSDLEHKTLDLLLGKKRSGATTAAGEIGRRYREIMVDEYQDSNRVQDAIFAALTREKHNCFMVGDVKQSIYQFRLADPSIFLEKYNSFSPAGTASDGDGRKILLSHNFRSGGEVIEAINDVFSACMSPQIGGLAYGEEEALREGIFHSKLPDAAVELTVIDAQEDVYREEASFVANRIHEMIVGNTLIRDGNQMRPVVADDIVILLRSPGSVGKYYQRALEGKGILCSSGAGMDLLKTEEIATLRSLLQTVVNPRQDIPLISTIASPVFGFTADDLALIRSKQIHGSVYDALVVSDHPKAVAFLQALKQLRNDAKMKTLTGFLENCFLLTRIDSLYGAMNGGEAKKANLQAFYQLAADFEKNNLRDIAAFLEHLDALEAKGLIRAVGTGGGAVTIMSIHKSKGLEFPVVFLCGLARSFNREDLRAQVLCDKELGVGLSVADTKNRVRYPSIAKRAISVKMVSESLSEELRVLYVAMTRARDRLIMVYSAKNITADLSDIALRMDFDQGRLLCADASCPGDWVLFSAMHRVEAEQLHAIGGRPKQLKIGKYPWKIDVSTPSVLQETAKIPQEEARRLPSGAEEMLRKALSYTYPHAAATQAPSKQTATGRKGRLKDVEAAENAQEPKHSPRKWRKPSFVEKKIEGKDYGNAIHAAMQFIRYEACTDEWKVKQEIDRLVSQNYLKQEQGDLADCKRIAQFFETDIGRQLRSGIQCVREFKFSVLDDGEKYGEGLAGEKVLLQGVVDCAVLETDGITILDFKTDRITEDMLPAVVQKYDSQVETYAEAMERIYQLPVKKKLLYFFHLNRLVTI